MAMSADKEQSHNPHGERKQRRTLRLISKKTREKFLFKKNNNNSRSHHHGEKYLDAITMPYYPDQSKLENHGIDEELMDKVKGLVNQHYEESMKESFYCSELAKELGPNINASEVDWECSFFYRHQPDSNIDDIPELLREAMHEYVAQLMKLAERLAELLSQNLGLEKDYLKKAFSEPFVGTKVAKYPQCSQPELVMGLRSHTDAGGIILLLQDDKVPGLEFLKDGEWMAIPPTKGYRIFVNLGDQVEVVSNGIYKSVRHRVLADKNGNRLSIATFYNPGGSAVISPAPRLVYPSCYRFEDYLNYYSTTKFSDKVARFQNIKEMFV